jgi:predicted metal-dependent phosphotriesterase family hydrolase
LERQRLRLRSSEVDQPLGVADKTVDHIAGEYIDQITNGVDDTGIKSGVIGEVGLSQTGPRRW